VSLSGESAIVRISSNGELGGGQVLMVNSTFCECLEWPNVRS